MEQYSVFILKEDLNPIIKKGMQGVVLEIYDKSNFECEFLDADGINFGFEGNYTFALNSKMCDFNVNNSNEKP